MPEATCTGTSDLPAANVPAPICPKSLAPQHHSWPFVRKAQTCSPPAAMACTWASPCTTTGSGLCQSSVPLPICPKAPQPQHFTRPSSSSAHENPVGVAADPPTRSEEHTSELQSRGHLVCRLLL